MDIFYKASVTDTSIGVATLAKWVRNVAAPCDNSISKSLVIARTMIFGESWDVDNHWKLAKHPAPEGVVITSYEVPTDADIWSATMRAKTAKHKALLSLGATGDAAAAIEYCRLELAGEINHSSGPAFA